MRLIRFISRSEVETEKIAARFAKTLRGGEIILLSGDLGAGKTVFVRGLAKGLGVRGQIKSPTFVLMRAHKVAEKGKVISSLVHVDTYRISDPRDLEAIGLLEYIGRPDTVVVIEWGERVKSLFRSHQIIRIALGTVHRNRTRSISITKKDARK